MTLPSTRPTGEQLRFVSSKTGEHSLDSYLEAAERGTRTISDMLSDLWDTSGGLRSDNLQFRITPAGQLQQRLGDFVDPNLGWQDVTDGFLCRPRGPHANATLYERTDIVTTPAGTFICNTRHTSTSTTPNANFTQILEAGTGNANGITFTPAGTIAATNVQAALQELDGDIQARVPTSRTLTASTGLTGGGDLSANRTLSFDVTWGDARYRLAGAVAWGDLTGVPSTFAPSAHTHPATAISDSSADGRSILTAGTFASMRTLLGLGTLATASSITASQISDATANGRAILTAADYAAMRTQLALVPGTNVQPQSTHLAALAAAGSVVDTVPYYTGSGSAALAGLTAFGRSLLDDADAATARATLGTPPTSLTVSPGTGLSGGGSLSANITLNFDTAWGDLRYRQNSGTIPWASLTGIPSTFTPSAHTLGSHSDVNTAGLASGQTLVWNGSTWLPGVAGGGGFRGDNGLIGTAASNDIFRIHKQNLATQDVTISATENAIAAGPLTIDTGRTLTVAAGGSLVIA